MKHTLYFIALLQILINSHPSFSQSGALDYTFNPNDIGFGNGDGPNSPVRMAEIQPDGKIIIAGEFTSYNGYKTNQIARINQDGSFDNSFNYASNRIESLNAISIQPDGKILIAGLFRNPISNKSNFIDRLNPDGSLDASFNTGSGTDGGIFSTAIQPDGKIIVAGWFNSYNGINAKNIARLNSDGSLDQTFNTGAGTDSMINTIAIQADGKIIIGGAFVSYNSTASNTIARINTDGTIDPAFNSLFGKDSIVSKILIQKDAKILVGRAVYNAFGEYSKSITRIHTNGSLDTSFDADTLSKHRLELLEIQSDDKILISTSISEHYIFRLNSNGSADTTFQSPPRGVDDISFATLQTDSKIITGGGTVFGGNQQNYLTRLHKNGTPDNSFKVGSGIIGFARISEIQEDEKILIGGAFYAYNGTPRNASLIRLHTDGALDATFNPDLDGYLVSIAIQQNQKIIAATDFSAIRLNTNGSQDITFKKGIVNGYIEDTYILQNNKIIIQGDFTGYNNTPKKELVLLNPDGTIDSTFHPDTTINRIFKPSIQNDGKELLLGKRIKIVNGYRITSIVKLNSNFTVDPAFQEGILSGTIYSYAISSAGKITLFGDFKSYNNVLVNGIAQINADGTLNNAFNAGLGVDSYVISSILQPDEKIIITGSFSSYNGIHANNIARLNADGSIDNTFQTGTGTNYPIYTSNLQKDGKVIIGGSFTSYDDLGRNRIARLNNIITSSVKNETFNRTPIKLYPNPNNGEFTVEASEKSTIKITDASGREVMVKTINLPQEQFNISKEKNGVYFLYFNSNNTQKTERVIINK